MKKLLILLINITFFVTNAQTEPVTYFEKMKEMTKELDTSQFANYTLYDKVYPLAKLRNFTQTVIDTSNSRHILQAAHEISIASNKNVQIDDDFLELIADNLYYNNHIVSVGILNVDMSFMKSDALDSLNPKLRVELDNNNKQVLRPVQGKQPFETREILVTSPLIKGITQENGAVTFDFKEAYFSKTNNPIQNLEVSIDNTTYQIIQNGSFVNEQIQHSFTTEGNNYLHFSGNYNNGTSFTTYAVINIDLPNNQFPSGTHSDEIWVRSDENFTPYEPNNDIIIPPAPMNYEFYSYNAIDDRPALKYQAFYANGRDHLEKPIIILDGIDFNIPGDCDSCDRNIQNILERLYYEDNGINIDLRDFFNQNGYDLIIVDFPVYPVGEITYSISPQFEDDNPGIDLSQYPDITYTYFRKGGADYIQRNAKAFKQFLREINAELRNYGSNEQLVVVGPSMGGQTSRYALTEMEANGENHNVRLWVSHDSPQQGANIPAGIQYMSFFFDHTESLKLLNRPASRELLVSHFRNRIHSSNSTNVDIVTDIINGNDYFRDNYKSELQNLGYPQLSRNLAISNGSLYGISTGTPGVEIANFHFWMNSAPWGDIGSGQAFYTSNDISNIVFYFHKTATVFVQDEFTICKNVNGIEESYDTAPGCYKSLSISEDINNEKYNFGIFVFWVNGYINAGNETPFTFMATKSTLDFQGYNKVLNDPLCRYDDLVTAHLTPFDSYYAPRENEWHNELTQKNVEWLWDEIQHQYSYGQHTSPVIENCNYAPPVLHITGPDLLCVNETATYTTLEDVPVVWNVNNMNIIAQDDRTITLTRDMNNVGNTGIITVSSPSTVFQDATKQVTCLPDFDVDYGNTGEIQLRTGNSGLTFDQQHITDVQWQLTHGNGSIIFADNTEARINSTDFYGEVTLTNPKGSVTKTYFGPNPDKCYILKKVDADKYQVIDRCNGYTPISTMPIKEIYDEFGNKIQDAPVVNDKLDVSQSGQSGDIRIIRVVVNGENVSKVIVKD